MCMHIRFGDPAKPRGACAFMSSKSLMPIFGGELSLSFLSPFASASRGAASVPGALASPVFRLPPGIPFEKSKTSKFQAALTWDAV